MSEPAPTEPAPTEPPAAPPATPEPLVPLTVAELAQLFANNRAAAIESLTKHAYSVIVEYVGKGLTTFEVHHPLLLTSWANDTQFNADLVAAIQAYFPGTSITFVAVSETNSIPHILFSYTPTP